MNVENIGEKDIWSTLSEPKDLTFMEGHEWKQVNVHGNRRCPQCLNGVLIVSVFDTGGWTGKQIYGFCPKCGGVFQYLPLDEE